MAGTLKGKRNTENCLTLIKIPTLMQNLLLTIVVLITLKNIPKLQFKEEFM